MFTNAAFQISREKNHSVNGVGVIGPIGSIPHSLFKINSTSIKTLNIKKINHNKAVKKYQKNFLYSWSGEGPLKFVPNTKDKNNINDCLNVNLLHVWKNTQRQRTKLRENQWDTDDKKLISLIYKELLKSNKKKNHKKRKVKNINRKFMTGGEWRDAAVQQHMRRQAPVSQFQNRKLK